MIRANRSIIWINWYYIGKVIKFVEILLSKIHENYDKKSSVIEINYNLKYSITNSSLSKDGYLSKSAI